MAQKRLLTRSSDGRYRKMLAGKIYYFGKVDPKNESRSYREAEERYLDLRAQRDRLTPVEVPVNKLTVGDFAEKYIQHTFERQERGEITPTHFERTKINMVEFAAFLGETLPLTQMTELKLEAYRNKILRKPNSNRTGRKISAWTAKSRLDAVKAALRWGYRVALIDRLPRNFDGYSRVSLPPPEVKVFTPAEIATFMAAANGRMRCWILLALNCGYGAADLSALRHGEVDLEQAVIHRRRAKTGVESRHSLWPETVAALRQAMTQDALPDARVFLSTTGRPLVHEQIVNDKLRKTDAVRSAFSRLKLSVDMKDDRGFYCFRKTAATAIERIDPTVTGMFLAHARRDMAKHYAAPAWERLDLAVAAAKSQLLPRSQTPL